MPKQDKLIVQLFKDTLIIFLLSMFTAAIGGIIDGIITGKFLGTESMAAFGFTVPYQLRRKPPSFSYGDIRRTLFLIF